MTETQGIPIEKGRDAPHAAVPGIRILQPKRSQDFMPSAPHFKPDVPEMRLLTRKQLAAELQCSPRHIQRLTAARVIPKIVISPRCVRYHREAVFAALVRRQIEAL